MARADTVFLVDMVLELPKDDPKLSRGVEAETESLKLDLEIIRATLHYPDKPRLATQKVRLKEVANLWEQVKFVLDTYLHNLEHRRPTHAVVNYV